MRDTAWDWEEELATPSFWASHYGFHDGEVPDAPPEEARPEGNAARFFGADADRHMQYEARLHNHAAGTHAHYRQLLDDAHGDGDALLARLVAEDPLCEVWPQMRDHHRACIALARGPAPDNHALAIPLVDGFGLTIEFVPGATMFHLDDAGGRVLLGHISGHHALPALRWDEVFAVERIVARARPGSWLARHVGLLLYPTAWPGLGDDVDVLRRRMLAGVRRAGVVRAGEEEAFVARRVAWTDELACDDPPDPTGGTRFAWWQAPPYGWVNNSPYGPRNPRSCFSCDREAPDGYARVARWVATLAQFEGDEA